jgi:hypothetical protein
MGEPPSGHSKPGNGKFEFPNVTRGTYTVQGSVALNGDVDSASAWVEVGD